MSKDKDRTILRRPDGTWENKRNDAGKASSLHTTQKAAEQATKGILRNQGGGELTTKGVNGKIRSKDTIVPGNGSQPAKRQGTLMVCEGAQTIQNISASFAGRS